MWRNSKLLPFVNQKKDTKWAASSEFVSSSIPSWQILTAHAQPFREARDLAFCLKVPLDSLLVWASSGGSGETARMRRLAWTFAARICDKYQIRLTRSKWFAGDIIDNHWPFRFSIHNHDLLKDLWENAKFSFLMKVQITRLWILLGKVLESK